MAAFFIGYKRTRGLLDPLMRLTSWQNASDNAYKKGSRLAPFVI
jgi:hypothetical protein